LTRQHADRALEEALRVEGGKVLATLARLTGDLGLAEDAVQEAVLTAIERWPAAGVPDNPAAWLTTTARRKALDRLRRESGRSRREEEAIRMLENDPVPPSGSVVRDDLLRLVFTCCHPALAPEARVALALRTLGGLTTAEIARAFLVPEATMAQRLVRAKRKIATAQVPYRVPADHELPDRLPAVLAVVYLVFTTGHAAPTGDALVRVDLCDEAVRLARLLAQVLPDESEVLGLLALLLVTDARRATRTDADGELVLLPDQDRARWDAAAVEEGAALAAVALRRSAGRPGPYALQAAIAAVHAEAPSWAATDWHELVGLYELLVAVLPTPVVALNRAVAIGQRDGAAAGLAAVDAVEGLGGYYLWHAARADHLRQLGRAAEAADAYRAALAAGAAGAERRFLERRLGDLTPATGRGA
jgi:RNA polymerase sigma-70 factor (ECF subfamily)